MRTKSFQIMLQAILMLLFCGLAFGQKPANLRINKQVIRHSSHTTKAYVATKANTEYLNRLRTNLLKNWLIPDGNNQVSILCTFNPSGFSDDFTVSSIPKCESAESAALAALKNCLPLPELPDKRKGAKLTIEFISTADPHGDSKSSINLLLKSL